MMPPVDGWEELFAFVLLVLFLVSIVFVMAAAWAVCRAAADGDRYFRLVRRDDPGTRRIDGE